jgi:hypothetical protein
MNAENAKTALLSDDELNAVAVGECGLHFTRVKCPIGHLEVTTTNCSSRLKGRLMWRPLSLTCPAHDGVGTLLAYIALADWVRPI